MSGEVISVSELVSRLKELSADAEASEADLAAAFRSDVPRLLEFLEKTMEVGEKAQEMLVKAYSRPNDGGHGIRIQSEDARGGVTSVVLCSKRSEAAMRKIQTKKLDDGVKLQWALRAIGIGDDAAEPRFTV